MRINLLLVEDNDDDAQLLLEHLRRADFEPNWQRVETEEDYLQKLSPDLDLIISDYKMPQFSGIRALELLKERGSDIPFLLFSGTIGEEKAVEIVKQGAADYLLKDRPGRLPAAIRQALEQSRMRKERRSANQTLRAERDFIAAVVDTAGSLVVVMDVEARIIRFNRACEQLSGYAAEEVLGQNLINLLLVPEDRESAHEVMTSIRAGQFPNSHEYEWVTKTGSRRLVAWTNTALLNPDGTVDCVISTGIDITERKQAEDRLTLLDKCVANLNDIVLITEAELIDDPGPRILFVNEAFQRITGFSPEEAIGKSPRFLQGEKTDRSILNEIRQALIQQQPIRRQIINYGKDGSEYWLDIDIVPILNSRGKCTYFAAIERDITEAKRSEESLRLFRALIDGSPDAIEVIDPKTGRLLDMNDTSCQRLGYTKEEMLRLSLRDIIDINDTDFDLKTAVASIQQSGSKTLEGRHQRKDGSTFPVEINVRYIYLDGGYLVAVVRDISERKRAEEQIAEQAALLDEARDAILVRDLEGNILFWNKGAERIYGYTSKEILGHCVRNVLYKDPTKFDELNRKSIRKGEWQGEVQHLSKDKRELTMAARWTVVKDKAGQPKSILAINSDITEKKKIEAQFLRAQRTESIGTLAGGIAHDLNNILAPILMSIDMLKLGLDQPKKEQVLETIEISAKRGADIVRQVLSFARGMDGEAVEVRLHFLVKELEVMITEAFPKDIRLKVSIQEDSWSVMGDPTQLHQVLLNLCVNARDAMPNGGNLTISSENVVLDEHYAAMYAHAKAGRYVTLKVSDSGTGMPSEVIEKIFEPFFTTKPIGKGTGLGLSTAMAIIKSHGGYVNVYSEMGAGTVFSLHLPAVDSSSDSPAKLELETLPRGHGETVLVVDDELSILTITGQTLEAFGYKALIAHDGAEAVAIFAQHRHDITVVLTDMAMPIMDGLATIRALKKIAPQVRIIAASGLKSSGSASKEMNTGTPYFLTKPYTAGALLKMLRTIIDN